MTDPLETLLAATKLTDGRIQLHVGMGRWRCTISHFNVGDMIWQHEGHPDPVSALRAALIEDERQDRDVSRRYDSAPKLGDAATATPPPTTNVEDMLG